MNRFAKTLVYLILSGIPILIVLSSVVSAHHIRGIPHYSYRSNYPETPVYEIVEKADQYIVTFTYYKIPGQDALDLAIYIRDSVDSQPFAEPVTFRVFGKREDPDKSHPFTAYRNPTNVYKVGWVYEEEGDYFVRVTFSDSLSTHNVLFELSVGGENRVWYYLWGAILLIIAFATIASVAKKRKATVEKINHG